MGFSTIALRRLLFACVLLIVALAQPTSPVAQARVANLIPTGCAHVNDTGLLSSRPIAGRTVAMTGSGAITGTVTLSSTGQGVFGIRVYLYGCYLFDEGGSPMTTVTDSTGRYSFTSLASGYYKMGFTTDTVNPPFPNTYVVTGPNVLHAWVYEPNTTVVNNSIEATPGGFITGMVRNSQGDPLPSVQVGLLKSDGVQTYSFTDAQGHYTVQAIPSGTYRIRFWPLPPPFGVSSGYAVTDYPTSISVTAPQTVTNINGVLPLGGAVQGVISDADTHSPISLYQTRIYLEGVNNSFASYWTSYSGSYTINSVPVGVYRVSADTYAPTQYMRRYYNNQPTAATATLITVTAGMTNTDINIDLLTGGQISGTVRDQWGGPLRFVQVQVLDLQNMVVASTTSASNGGYLTAPGLPSGAYRVRFSTTSLDFCQAPMYATRYYPNASTPAGASLVSVTQGAVTPNIDAVMLPLSPIAYLPLIRR
jgi:hypothetical protein